ncbi:uncharacterized protein LOC120334884 isoform X2 [Styela clava]
MVKSPKRRRMSASSHHSSEGKAVGMDMEEAATTTKDSDKKEGESSPARCPICLAPPENPAKSESCSHFFCFICLKTWSKQKAECPLCKMPIRTIYYDIKSDTEFHEYHVQQRPAETRYQFPNSSYRMINIESFDNWWHGRMLEFRNQQRRRENSLAAREALSNVGLIRERRMHYWNKKKVHRVDTGNRVRDISAEFYRQNPSQMHRLEPWLRRELTVLYGAHNRLLIRRVRDLIMSAVTTIGMTSPTFYSTIQPYMLEHTAQFVHEFVSFAKSPYDMVQYDRHAQYDSTSTSEESQRRSGGGSRDSVTVPRRRRSRNPTRIIRWEESPDAANNVPGEPTSQSVMLSNTSWGEDLGTTYPPSNAPYPPSSSTSTLSYPRSSNRAYDAYPTPPPPRDFPVAAPEWNVPYSRMMRYMNRPPTIDREVEAPLVHQSIDLHRPGGSSARHYDRMEVYRRHFDRHSRRRRLEESRKLVKAVSFGGSETIREPDPPEVIVISSDSSDKEQEPGPSDSDYRRRSPVLLHYHPTEAGTSRSNAESTADDQRPMEVKIENSAESQKHDSASVNSDSEDSEIEFVKYVKPPHLRTPEAFINISSTDEDQPGPSTRGGYYEDRNKKPKPIVTSSSSSSSSSEESSSDERNPDSKNRRRKSTGSYSHRDVLQRTRDFLNRARNASRSHSNDDVTIPSIATVTPVDDTEFSGEPFISPSDHSPEAMPIPTRPVTSPTPLMTSSTPVILSPMMSSDNAMDSLQTASNSVTSQSADKQNPKKIFEKGKVTINFEIPGMKGIPLYSSDSDSEIDVGMETKRTPLEIYSAKPYEVENSQRSRSRDDFENNQESPQIHGELNSPNYSFTSSSSSENRERIRSHSSDLNSQRNSRTHEQFLVNSNAKEPQRHRSSSLHKKKKHSRKSHKKRSRHHGESDSLTKHHRESRSSHEDDHNHKSKKHRKKSSKHHKSRSSSVEFVSRIRNY